MAGRNGSVDGPVIVPLRVPWEMRVMLKRYQIHRRLPSINAAVVELLESHPEIRRILAEILDENVMGSLCCCHQQGGSP